MVPLPRCPLWFRWREGFFYLEEWPFIELVADAWGDAKNASTATWDPDPNGWMTWPGNCSCVRWYDFNGRWCWTGSWQANSMNREHRQQLLLLFTTDVPSYKNHLCKIVYGFRRGLSFFNTTTITRALETKWSCFHGFFADREWSDQDQVFHWTCESAVLWTLSFPCLIATHPWRIIKSIYATTGMRGRFEFHFPWRSPTQRAIT